MELIAQINLEPSLKERLHSYSQLHDFYGPLLTDKQRTCFAMHYLEDYSLTEIAEELQITPQAVADQLKRTIGILYGYEEKLGFIQDWQEQQEKLRQLKELVDRLLEKGDNNGI